MVTKKINNVLKAIGDLSVMLIVFNCHLIIWTTGARQRLVMQAMNGLKDTTSKGVGLGSMHHWAHMTLNCGPHDL